MVRVLVVSAWPPWPLTDGGRLVLHHHLRHLAARHDVTVLAASRPPGAPVPEGASASWFGPARQGLREYARRWRLVRLTGEPHDVHRVCLPALLTAFDAEIAAEPDIVHLHGWGTAALARRAGAVPTVHMAIDSWATGLASHQRAGPPWRRVLERREAARVATHEARHYPRCAAVVVVTEDDAGAVRRSAPDASVRVVRNGVEAGPEPRIGRREPILAFHGVLSTDANVRAARALVRDILPLVLRSHPATRVLIVGRDPVPAVQRLASKNVEVTGEVSDVRQQLDRAAVYVAAIDAGSGLRNKVLEAMAAGLPVVGTPLALRGIGAGDGTVVASDAEELAAAVGRLLDDSAHARALGAAGRARVTRDFGWKASAVRLEEVWLDAAGGQAL